MKIIGYVVIESCEDYEQILGLAVHSHYPDGGLLYWSDDGYKRTVFSTRKEARDAINRTHNYTKAFSRTDFPEKQFCKIVPVVGGQP